MDQGMAFDAMLTVSGDFEIMFADVTAATPIRESMRYAN